MAPCILLGAWLCGQDPREVSEAAWARGRKCTWQGCGYGAQRRAVQG